MTEESFLQIFSRRLRYYMSIHDISQKELAEQLGVGTTSVYNWCNGIKSPRMDKVDRMCKIFGCRRSDLMESAPAAAPDLLPLSAEESDLVLGYRSASEDTRAAARAVLGVKKDAASSSSIGNAAG